MADCAELGALALHIVEGRKKTTKQTRPQGAQASSGLSTTPPQTQTQTQAAKGRHRKTRNKNGGRKIMNKNTIGIALSTAALLHSVWLTAGEAE